MGASGLGVGGGDEGGEVGGWSGLVRRPPWRAGPRLVYIYIYIYMYIYIYIYVCVYIYIYIY